jgi:acetyl-CoA C-acetyltransferase
MATIDPRTPVIVGAGQVTQRAEPPDALEPVDLIAEAARLAAADAKAPGLLQRVESVRTVLLLSWRYVNAAALVAERIGASPRQTAVTTMGGNSPQTLLNETALAIQRGDLDVALLGGAETWRTRMALRRQDTRPDWAIEPEGTEPAEVLGHELPMTGPAEATRGIVMPVQVYPVFECALRAAAGRTWSQQRDHIARLWARFSEVASRNPHAWVTEARTAAEIREPSAENRMVGFPYTKLLNSNNDVDQSAALLVCSVEAARANGIPEDRWVFPWSGTDAHDTPFVSNRLDLHSSPAIRIAGGRALELAGVTVDDLAHVDLYSCFPSAVQVAAAELGIGLDRDLTVTGGLTFAGGPWNDYVMHAIATMVGLLRDDPDAVGLCTANGGSITKHAFGVYSASPPAQDFQWQDCQAEVDALAQRQSVDDHEGDVTVEAYTVMHERDGSAQIANVACLLPGGARTWATATDPDVLAALVSDDEHVGDHGVVEGGELRLPR